ncbi:hypothetical protein [Microbulbifer taiwanensis]|uniref:hypothetical protein n=1 Tax=Microbulbifer taiwanensis TaxID=986746 RepID=UPI003607561F
MSRENIYSRDEAWLKDTDESLSGAAPLDEAAEDISERAADSGSEAGSAETPAAGDTTAESSSTPMQSYLKHLYRLELLTPEEEHTTTCLLRDLEDKLIALLQKRGVELVQLRSEGWNSAVVPGPMTTA